MAQFHIQLPPEYMQKLGRDMADVRDAQDNTRVELPLYPEFVHHLMKNMPTPVEELHHAATGMAGEAGEVLDLSKKVWVYGRELDAEKFIEELGDVRFYYQAMLNFFGVTDEMVQAQNVIKLRKRYASGHFTNEQANARADKPALGEKRDKAAPAPERRYMGQRHEQRESAVVGRWFASRVERPDASNLWNAVRRIGDKFEEYEGTPSHDEQTIVHLCIQLNERSANNV